MSASQDFSSGLELIVDNGNGCYVVAVVIIGMNCKCTYLRTSSNRRTRPVVNAHSYFSLEGHKGIEYLKAVGGPFS